MSVIDLFTRKYASALKPSETKVASPLPEPSVATIVAPEVVQTQIPFQEESSRVVVPDTPSKKQVSFKYPEYEEKLFSTTDKIIPSPKQGNPIITTF
jgi:hypothetical protein